MNPIEKMLWVESLIKTLCSTFHAKVSLLSGSTSTLALSLVACPNTFLCNAMYHTSHGGFTSVQTHAHITCWAHIPKLLQLQGRERTYTTIYKEVSQANI